MASTKGKLLRLFSAFGLERATLDSLQEIGSFRRMYLRCNVKAFSAGAKVQLLLPCDDTRTYTPIPAPGGIALLGWKHGDGPGSRWLEQVRVGDELPFVGPQRSLELGAGPVVLIGDETSVAVAAAFAMQRPGQVHTVIQSDAASDVRQAAASVGLQHVDIVVRGDTGATVSAVAAKLSTSTNAVVALTGGSELIVDVRDALRHAGVRNIKTKTYWIPGKTGLD